MRRKCFLPVADRNEKPNQNEAIADAATSLAQGENDWRYWKGEFGAIGPRRGRAVCRPIPDGFLHHVLDFHFAEHVDIPLRHISQGNRRADPPDSGSPLLDWIAQTPRPHKRPRPLPPIFRALLCTAGGRTEPPRCDNNQGPPPTELRLLHPLQRAHCLVLCPQIFETPRQPPAEAGDMMDTNPVP